MFKGAITAIVTPFLEDGGIDEASLRNLILFQIENKIDGIVPCGTTGESPTLSHEELNRVVKLAIDAANGKVPVIAGTGSNSTREAISMTKHASDNGADASLQVCPYYNKPTQEGLFRHFSSIAKAADIPIIIYNIQGRTGINMETATLARLAKEHSNIIGVKEASGNAAQLHYELLPLFKGIFIETNPIPIKAALAMKGLVKEVDRLPMCEMKPENKEKLKKILTDLKLLEELKAV